jgi:uncharacterized protein YjbJ (UPF0337 family)
MENTQKKTAESFKIVGNWADQAKGLKNKFSQLTDSDLKFEKGKDNELVQRIESRLNKNRDEVIKLIRMGQSN